jgi:hypothetical protein
MSSLLHLEAAARSLPLEPGGWAVPPAVLKAVALEDNPAAVQRMICQFAAWARENVSKVPAAPADELQATDFNDYYKIVMSRVQFIYAQADAGAGYGSSSLSYPVCSFQTQLRRAPTFRKDGREVTLGVLDVKPSSAREGSFPPVSAAFREQLAAVGARRFDEATLRMLIASRSPLAQRSATRSDAPPCPSHACASRR